MFDPQLLALSPPGWGGVLLRGLATSLQVAGAGYGLGLLIGFCGAIARLSGPLWLRDLVVIYTTLIRAIPELVLILLIYFAGTAALNAGLERLGLAAIEVSPFAAGITVIALVQGAYATEVIRGAIQAIPRGQIEAAAAFGLTRGRLLRRIVLPAMLPHALPGLANLWLIATKDTALLAVVGFTELTLATRQAAGTTKHYLTFFCAAGVLYLAVTLISTVLFRWLERRSRRHMQAPRA
ncbi:ABC transporter permease [Paracoccus pacificus]|uniref:ABC transporter permease n=1 Tax=Paracoccus pacificus TaxID=1463598 RepID=A0ABW4R4B5_9RHOB